ncbi:hypothetical protein [Gordonia hongkongensis]|uniref:hypothetical protein n=1 Tax=Gordonia hongkongensis TaxID=1701090 RepID=UPI003D75C237
MSDQLGAVIYAGQRYGVPTQVVEDIEDCLESLDLLGGSHLYRLGGGGDEPYIRFWITPGTPIALEYPNGYKTPEGREDYVVRRLQMEARYRLGLPLDGSGDKASAVLDDDE